MPVSDWHVQRQYYQDTKKGGGEYIWMKPPICIE